MATRARLRLGLRLACAVALCWIAGSAAAHDFPTPFKLLFDESEPPRIVALLRPGLVLSENGGSAWDFVCGAVSGTAGDATYPALLAGPRLLIGGYVRLYRDDGFGCGWSRVEGTGLPGGRIVSLQAGDDGSVLALVAPGRGDAALFVSRDDGQTWSAMGAPLSAAVPRSAVRAPGDRDRWYVLDLQPSAAVVWVSEDAAAHWSERATLPAECSEILAVDPTDADRTYVRCGARVLVSADAARSFETWAEVPELGGFAIAPDASSRWVGSRTGGLWREDGDGELQLLHEEVHVGCLQFHEDTLWVCARDDRGYDPYALATSRDRGETLRPFLRSMQVSRLRSCGNAQQAAACSSEWRQWQSDVALSQPPAVGLDSDAGAGDAGDAGIQAGPEPDAAAPAPPKRPSLPTPRAACAVLDPSASTSPGCWVWMGLVAAVSARISARLRRRPSRRRRCGGGLRHGRRLRHRRWLRRR